MEEGVEFSYIQIDIAIRIKLSKITKPLTIAELTKICDVTRTNPIFYKVLTILINRRIIFEVERFGSTKLVKINHRELKKFIWRQQKLELFKEYFRKNHGMLD